MGAEPCSSPCFDDVGHDFALVVVFGFARYDGDGPFRAVAETRAEAVAHEVADEPGLAVDDLDGALGAVRDAERATGAFFFESMVMMLRSILESFRVWFRCSLPADLLFHFLTFQLSNFLTFYRCFHFQYTLSRESGP
jgi:hypothetical protein